MKIGEKLLIHPLWEDEVDSEGRAVLKIEPGLAFGSGTHETTRLCLETLEKYIEPGKTVLDLGCGSGILSGASLLLGAENATGVLSGLRCCSRIAGVALGNACLYPQIFDFSRKIEKF